MENHLCVLLREAKYDPKKMEQLISLFSPLIREAVLYGCRGRGAGNEAGISYRGT